jgi:hypothetical protein
MVNLLADSPGLLVAQLMPWVDSSTFLSVSDSFVPVTLVTRPPLPPPVVNKSTKPQLQRRITTDHVLPVPREQLSAYSRQLVDTLYEGMEVSRDQSDKQVQPLVDDKEVVPPRSLVPMPSVSDFTAPSRSVSPSVMSMRTTRPFNQPFQRLTLEGGVYLRSGRLVLPPGFFCTVHPDETDFLRFHSISAEGKRQFLARVELENYLDFSDLPFFESSGKWVLSAGDYIFPEMQMNVSVREQSLYSVESFQPADPWADAPSGFY